MEEGFEEKWLREQNVSPNIAFNWMYLVLTTECNLLCKYCAVLGNKKPSNHHKKWMDIEIGKAAVRFYAKHLQET